ncbi:hypothetical protein ACFOGJ_19710 [Marinibaculum pumilum]|uniref:DUF2802 domain-containing protein n=1 Tax=Marinibaculum pumilum TaxID=1766165 RepID=A0ABV7L4L6_9PROT
MDPVWTYLQALWQQSPPETLALFADVLLTAIVLVAVVVICSRLLSRQRRLEEAATASQKEIVERLETVTVLLEQKLTDAAEKLNRDIAVIAEDAREARRIGRSLPGQLERIQAGLTAAQDELLNQSVAKYQANEAIRTALTGKPAAAAEQKRSGKGGS